jgi:hypothetical protein
VWVDPQANLIYIFLSNRVYNTRANNLLAQMNVRGKIQDAIYRALKREAELAAAAEAKTAGAATDAKPGTVTTTNDQELQDQNKELKNQLLFN